MSDPKIIQPNARCPFCTIAFYISVVFVGNKDIQCLKCGSLFLVDEARLKQEKKKK